MDIIIAHEEVDGVKNICKKLVDKDEIKCIL